MRVRRHSYASAIHSVSFINNHGVKVIEKDQQNNCDEAIYSSSEIYQDVFFIHDEEVMSYKKGRPTKFEGNDTVVEEYKNPMKLTTRISDGLLHYTKVH